MPTLFRAYSLGVSTNRDAVVYDFDTQRLEKRVQQFAEDYNNELDRWRKKAKPPKDPKELVIYIDNFVSYEHIKWSRNLKRWLKQKAEIKVDESAVCESLYRPFTKMALHFQRMLVDEVARVGTFFPTAKSREENILICINLTVERPFACLATNLIPNLVATAGFGSATYCFPLYTIPRHQCAPRGQHPPLYFATFSEALSRQRHYVAKTSFTTSTESCTIRPTAPTMPKTSSANWPEFRSPARPRTFTPFPRPDGSWSIFTCISRGVRHIRLSKSRTVRRRWTGASSR